MTGNHPTHPKPPRGVATLVKSGENAHFLSQSSAFISPRRTLISRGRTLMSLTRPIMSRGCPLLSLSVALAVTICPINQLLNFSQSALAQSFREKCRAEARRIYAWTCNRRHRRGQSQPRGTPVVGVRRRREPKVFDPRRGSPPQRAVGRPRPDLPRTCRLSPRRTEKKPRQA